MCVYLSSFTVRNQSLRERWGCNLKEKEGSRMERERESCPDVVSSEV